MDGAGAIIAVVFVALALTGGAIVAAYASSTTALEYGATENVSTGATNQVVTLANSSDQYYWSDSVDVVNISSNNPLVATEDYSWNKNNGTITPLSSQAANTYLNVSYAYGSPSDSQRTATNTIAMLLDSGAYIPLLLVLALVTIAITVFGGFA